MDPKTLRKVLNFEPISKRVSASLETYISKLTGLENPKSHFTPPEDMLKNQAQWWGYLKGYEAQPENKYFKVYIGACYKMLMSEVTLAKQMRTMELSLAQPMIYFFSSDYVNCLLPDELSPTYTLQQLKKLDGTTHPDIKVQSDEQFRLPFINGIISLILYLDAAKEVDIQTILFGAPSEVSLFSDSIPSFSSSGQFEYPLKKLLNNWQRRFNINSVEKLAKTAPTNFGSGPDERTRKVKYWMSGEYTPDENAENKVEDWICAFSGLEKDDDQVLIETIRFSTACIQQRLLKEIQTYGGIAEASTLVPAFSQYERHYQNHLSEYLLETTTADVGPSA